jgi:hypothetical protein
MFAVLSRSSCVRVVAKKQGNPGEGFAERLAERRRMLEQVRNVSVTRVRSDLDKIVKREADFAKQVLEEIVPVRIVWNEGMSLEKLLPFRVEVVDTTANGVRVAPRPDAGSEATADYNGELDGEFNEPIDKPSA